jgi:hypothetical protein
MPYVGNTNTTFTTFTTSDANVTDDLTVTDDASVGGDLTLTGSLKNGSTHFNVDSSGDVIIDSDTGNWRLKDAGTTIVEFFHASDEVYVNSPVDGQNIRFNVNNGGSAICPLKIHAEGYVVKETQPAIQAKISSTQSNITAGSLYTIPFATEIFDQNSNYNNSTYTFTAPVTGRYFIGVQATIGGQPTGSNYYQYTVVTSNRTYNTTVDPDKYDSSPVYDTFPFIVLADMDASDTCIVKFLVEGSTDTLDFYAETYLSIFLAC